MIGKQSQPLKTHSGIGDRGAVGVWMDFDGDPLQESRLLQCFPAPQNSVADDRIMLPVKAGSHCLHDSLLFEESQRTKTAVCEESRFSNAELEAETGNPGFLFARRKRIAQPFPSVPFVNRNLVPLDHRQGALPVKIGKASCRERVWE